MTRQEILDDYTVDASGVIRNPGKFEGEMIYVPYFWDLYLDGSADSDNGKVLGFKITPEDRIMFPELPKRKRTIRLAESDQGFVGEV
jgi:hypothetical protein